MVETIDPPRLFEMNGVVLPVLTAGLGITAGTNQQVIAATSGKRIRVMGWIAQGDGGIGTYLFKSNSGGTQLTGGLYCPNGATAGLHHFFPITNSGYFETSTGHGLFADVATATINFTIFYISYTP